MRISLKKELVVFLVILAIAAFFRLYRLDQFPPGLYPDEAMNGNNALQSLSENNFRVFYPENNGREGLFINIQAISVAMFGNQPWALRFVSSIFGILTIAGLYLLTRELYDWRLASLASFLMAVSFWHVNFSRIGFRAIMVPFILVFVFYFLWRGLKYFGKFDFIMAGVFAGLGFHTYISYRIAPLIGILIFLNYWWYLKKDFSNDDYNHSKIRLLQGFVLTFFTMILVALPIGIYYLNNQQDFIGRALGTSVFNTNNPIKSLSDSLVKTLGMFNFAGDWNQRHNIAGSPMLHWTMGVFFIIGFIKEFSHWVKRKHGHISTVHTLLFSWLFLMLIPGFLSLEAPHAIRTIGVIPVVMILSARGIWWLFDKMSDWYKTYNPNSGHEQQIVQPVAIIIIILIGMIGLIEYWRYFIIWGPNPNTDSAFNQNYVELANQINKIPESTVKNILINASGVLVNGIPMPSQTVMFLTDTFTLEKQKQNKIFYITNEQFQKGEYDKNGIVIPIENDK